MGFLALEGAGLFVGDSRAVTMAGALAVIAEGGGVGRRSEGFTGEVDGMTVGVTYVRVVVVTTVVVVMVVTSVIRVPGGRSVWWFINIAIVSSKKHLPVTLISCSCADSVCCAVGALRGSITMDAKLIDRSWLEHEDVSLLIVA